MIPNMMLVMSVWVEVLHGRLLQVLRKKMSSTHARASLLTVVKTDMSKIAEVVAQGEIVKDQV